MLARAERMVQRIGVQSGEMDEAEKTKHREVVVD